MNPFPFAILPGKRNRPADGHQHFPVIGLKVNIEGAGDHCRAVMDVKVQPGPLEPGSCGIPEIPFEDGCDGIRA